MADNTPNIGPTAGVNPGINPQALASVLAALVQAKAAQAFPTPSAVSGSPSSGQPGIQTAPGVTVLPPASPFPGASSGAPTTTGGADPDAALKDALLKSTQYGQQATQEQIERARTLGNQVGPLVQQQANIPVPPMGKQWHVGTWTDPQGNVHHQGFLKNLLNVLGMIGTATRPGQAIESAYYGPAVRHYEAETGAKAKQIEEIQKQQELEQQPIPSTAGMVYHPIMAGARLTSAEAAQSRAETAKASLQNTIGVDAERLRQGWANLDMKGQQLAALQMYRNAYLQAYNYRTQAIMEVAGSQNLTREQIAQAQMDARSDVVQAMSENSFVKEHPFITQVLGLNPNMVAPATPTIPGTSVVPPGTSGPSAAPQNPSRPAAPKKPSGGRRVVDLTK